MSKKNKQLIHRWFEEVWNRRNSSAIDEMLTEETIHHGLGITEEKQIQGIDEFKKFYQEFLTLFPVLNVEIKDCISEGDKVSIRCLVTATTAGEDGREVEFTGSGICTIKDGRFVEIWNEFNFMKMYSQLGFLTFTVQ